MQIKSYLFFLFFTSCSFSYSQSDWNHSQTIDSLFFALSREGKPGFGITVIEDGKVVYDRCTGMANVAKKTPFSNLTPIALASVSKQFTAMSILLLEESGKLNTNDDIRKYIPELPEYPKTISINHLLTHTSGIRDHITMLEWDNNQKQHFYDFKGTLKCLQKYDGLSFEPGEDFAYSNTGFVLLALIVERASGIPFEEFVQKNIFAPLEMNDSKISFNGKSGELGQTASYNWKKDNFIRKQGIHMNALGATGVYTTLSDFIKWDQNFYTNDLGKGGQSIIDRMNISGQLNNGSSVNYGNGQKYRTIRGVDLIEHSGGWAFFNFQYTRIPSRNLSIIISTNNEFDYPIGMADQMLDVLITESNPNSSAVYQLKNGNDYDGIYIAPNNTLRILKFAPPNINVIAPNPYSEKIYTLTPVNDRCLIDSMDYQLCFNNEINTGFIWAGGSYFTVPTKYERVDSIGFVNPETFVGTYYCDELGKMKVKYSAKKKKLYCTSSFRGKTVLIPEAATVFKACRPNFTIQFKSDHLLMGNNRVYNVKFKKTP